jgi:hypothetical protein
MHSSNARPSRVLYAITTVLPAYRYQPTWFVFKWYKLVFPRLFSGIQTQLADLHAIALTYGKYLVVPIDLESQR